MTSLMLRLSNVSAFTPSSTNKQTRPCLKIQRMSNLLNAPPHLAPLLLLLKWTPYSSPSPLISSSASLGLGTIVIFIIKGFEKSRAHKPI